MKGNAVEDKITIYIAGNPNGYPVEYYNSDTEKFEGVIPQLFAEFSAQSKYDIVYYQPNAEDNRQQLAENLQVDVVSDCDNTEAPLVGLEEKEVFSAGSGENEQQYSIGFTEIAPAAFREELTAYLDTVSAEQVNGILIDTAVTKIDKNNNYLTVGALLFIIIMLLYIILITVRKYRKSLYAIRRHTETDEVSGMGNTDYLQSAWKKLYGSKTKVLYCLLYFSVDTERLYRVNGVREAEEFLRGCSDVLMQNQEPKDVLSRWANRGFAVIKFCPDLEKSLEWAKKVCNEMNFYTENLSGISDAKVTCGIYRIQKNDVDLKEMMVIAAQCALIAKEREEKVLLCEESILQQLTQERLLQASMEQAFIRNEFALYIQFYVDIHSGRIVGGEALSRWIHPQKGLIMPGVFVPLMEREKSISRLDYYCLEKACKFLSELKQKKIESFFLSCNFSRESFSAADFAAKCEEIMKQYDFAKELLIFELTESTAAKNVQQIQKNILQLKRFGVRIALDDFGEGFTSFYDLQKYQIDGIKLDKALIDSLLTPSGNAVIKAMVQVGHELGMTILAEGVENDKQVELLKNMNCDVIQGFRFFTPLPDWEAEKKIVEEYF